MAGHKWWRVSNIVKRIPTSEGIVIAEMDFINDEGVDNSPSNSAIAKGYDASFPPRQAFNNSEYSFCAYGFDGVNPTQDPTWWIGYVFSTPVTVNSIGLQMFQDMQPTSGYEWQSAVVEHSDDGNVWTKHGVIEPKITTMDLSYIVTPILDPYSVKGRSLQDNGLASRFVLINDWQTGDFIKKIVPSSSGEWEYRASNQKPVLVTHVGADGFAPQSDGGVIPQ